MDEMKDDLEVERKRQQYLQDAHKSQSINITKYGTRG